MQKKFFLTSTLILLFSIAPFCTTAYSLPTHSPIITIDVAGQVFFNGIYNYTSTIHESYTNTYSQPAPNIPEKSQTNQLAQHSASNNQPSRAKNGDIRAVLKIASSLLGSNYVYGGQGPNNFDCSGFTKYVYEKVGINLPHFASSQINYGKKVNRNELLPGDLVFFSFYGGSDIQHVGIYIGNGEFIHASTKRGVITTPLSQDYYVKNYKGAVRLIR